MEVKKEANDRYFAEVLRRRHRQVFWQPSCSSANSYYFDRHGDVPLRPSTTLETYWRSRTFRLSGLPIRESARRGVSPVTRMDAPDWQPSLASHLVAMSSRTTLRPLAQLMPSNAYGLAVMDRVLRTALVASRPRRGVTVRKVDTVFAGGPVRGDWITTPAINPHANPLLYIHGGAYSMCSPETHRGLLGELASASGRPIFAVKYRLAPRYPYPAAADDALNAYRWLTSGGSPGSCQRTVAVAGDSAGGQLTMATALGARAVGLPLPDAMLLMSPVLDLRCELARARELRRRDPFLPPLNQRRALLTST